ncbi:Ribonuclease 3 [Porphyridium purpureum]|uniref:Ribonuclease 3 n=1 Tax=Porphyridium purpureum TaxID=35688 RepID=A0A5J4YI05_PORPP|nr:Ribonuclease 3 [Porphyridium purpureum]|eukprot:POR7816..scf297_16
MMSHDGAVRVTRGDYSCPVVLENDAPEAASMPLNWGTIMASFPQQAEDIQQFEKGMGLKFRQPELLFEAFTHVSAHTLPVWVAVIPKERKCYERLECMGDSLLRTIILHNLCVHAASFASQVEEDRPKFNERWLTLNVAALSRAEKLTVYAREIGLAGGLMANINILSDTQGQTARVTRERIIGDVVEAVIGALYFDQGFDSTRDVVSMWLKPHILALSSLETRRDAKGQVLEIFSRKRVPIEWKTDRVEGASCESFFECTLAIGDTELASARGRTKKQAVEAAAAAYLAMLEANVVETRGQVDQFSVPERDERVVEICRNKHPLCYINETVRRLTGKIPQWDLVDQQGESHAPIFVMSMNVSGVEKARAAGASKKLAKEQAACIAVIQIKERGLESRNLSTTSFSIKIGVVTARQTVQSLRITTSWLTESEVKTQSSVALHDNLVPMGHPPHSAARSEQGSSSFMAAAPAAESMGMAHTLCVSTLPNRCHSGAVSTSGVS